MKKFHLLLLLVIIVVFGTTSCQKTIELAPEPEIKVGSTWEYYYTLYWPGGLIREQHPVIYVVAAEETIGGETWFKVTDINTGAIVWYLNKKTGGMYQYANSTSNLFFKYPAAVGDTYNTYNDGAAEQFKVISTTDSIYVKGLLVPVNRYDGTKSGLVVDKMWYNPKRWVIRKEIWGNNIIMTQYYLKSTLVLQKFDF